MDKRSYNLVVGVILMVAALAFFALPALVRSMDAMIPVLIAIVCFILALVFFFTGNEERTDKA